MQIEDLKVSTASSTIRIIACFGLEGTFSGHLAHPPCNEEGHLYLDQVGQSPVQTDLEELEVGFPKI